MRDDLAGKLTIPLKEGTVFYHTYISDKPVVIPDISSERRFSFLPYIHQLGLQSAVCTPIRGDREPFGTICIYSKKKNGFSKRDIDFVFSLSNILGLAVKRHRYDTKGS